MLNNLFGEMPEKQYHDYVYNTSVYFDSIF